MPYSNKDPTAGMSPTQLDAYFAKMTPAELSAYNKLLVARSNKLPSSGKDWGALTVAALNSYNGEEDIK